MDTVRKITFDTYCGRMTIIILFLSAAVISTDILGSDLSDIPLPLSFLAVIAGDISAFTMLTLYFNMLNYAVTSTFVRENITIEDFITKSSKAFYLLGGISMTIKLLFFSFLLLTSRGGEVFIHTSALIFDICVSMLISLRTLKKQIKAVKRTVSF